MTYTEADPSKIARQKHKPPPAVTKTGEHARTMNLTNDQFQEWTKAQGLSHAIGRAFWGTLPQELEGRYLPFSVDGESVSFRVVRLGNLAGGYAPGVEFNFWEVGE